MNLLNEKSINLLVLKMKDQLLDIVFHSLNEKPANLIKLPLASMKHL